MRDAMKSQVGVIKQSQGHEIVMYHNPPHSNRGRRIPERQNTQNASCNLRQSRTDHGLSQGELVPPAEWIHAHTRCV